MSILDFYIKKRNKNKISMITCYDYTSANILQKTSVDCLLVGDSVAMVMHGYKDTLSATLEMMVFHTSAVSRGAGEKFIVADLPFLSYRKSLRQSVKATEMLMRAGAHAVKLESVAGNEKLIRHLTDSGVPVMGHIGLTPQLVNMLGGLRVQGKTNESADKLLKDAFALQEAGCFSLVLECVPAWLAKDISDKLEIATIGIGAGPDTDGQVMVFQDMLGLNENFKPKFVKYFLQGETYIKKSVNDYVAEVQSGGFPANEHCYGN